MNARIFLIFCVFIIFWLVLFIRIFDLSVLKNKEYEEQARKNVMHKEVIAPIRGQIFDRNGEILATNSIGFTIALLPRLSLRSNLPVLEKEIENLLSFFPQYTKEELLEKYRKKDSPYNHDFIPVIDFVEHDFIIKNYPKLSQSELLRILPLARRYYPYNHSASHVVGYVGRANQKEIEQESIAKYTGNIGKEGLERSYDTYLQGELGHLMIKMDAFNREMDIISQKGAIEGSHLKTTLDIRVQQAMDRIFANKNGAAIIMDAQNGEILAAGSYPEYNLNWFVGGISHKNWNALRNSPYKPLINKFINGLYPPGSVIKMGMGLAFLENTEINENEKIDTPPYIESGGIKFRDWKKEGHGKSDLFKALKESVDVYFYILSQKVDFEKVADVLKQMGFGERTGVDLANESRGIVPSPSYKLARFNQRWYEGDSIISSIGQGLFLTTPLQVANYTALIASDRLPTPHFVKEIGDEVIQKDSKDVLNPFQKSKMKVLREGMRQACSESGGTAYRSTSNSKASLACKTGTAQVVGISREDQQRIKEEEMDYFHRSQAWITGFLPANNPKYVITIMVEHGGSGSGTSGPILAELANVLVDLGYVPAKIK